MDSGLASGLPEGTFIRFGAEVARNLNDGDKLRVIPMITYGATENVDYFFDRFEAFYKPPYHPAWKTTNVATKVPGWTRYWVAEERVRRLTAAGAKFQPPAPAGNAQSTGQRAARTAPHNSTREEERLFREFLEWTRRRPRAR